VLGIQGVKQQLRAAGHPDHQYTPDDIVYELAHGLQHLEEAAVDLQQVLASWQDNIKAIHDQYNLSLFLSTHQLVAASDLLKALLSDGMYSKHCVACCLADVACLDVAQSSFATAAHLGSISWLQPCTHC